MTKEQASFFENVIILVLLAVAAFVAFWIGVATFWASAFAMVAMGITNGWIILLLPLVAAGHAGFLSFLGLGQLVMKL